MFDEALLSLKTSEEKELHKKSRVDYVSWKLFVEKQIRKSDSPSKDLRRLVMKLCEKNTPSTDIIIQILESLLDWNDEVGEEARHLIDEIC
jgi:hypothetical protein